MSDQNYSPTALGPRGTTNGCCGIEHCCPAGPVGAEGEAGSNFTVEQIDWREDRYAIKGPHNFIVTGLTKQQSDALLSYLRAVEQNVVKLRRFSAFEHEDGIYENPAGSFVVLREVKNIFEV